MDLTFFEQHLDRDLYQPKKLIDKKKEPLRILVTDAGGKIAYNIIYELCSGNVFGLEQEIIIHLINSRGSMPHKSIFMELEQCGFSTCKDFVVSSNPEVAYNKVDIVIAIATFEEIPGRSISNSLVYQMIKCRQVAVYVQQYASKNAKIIITGPSTKAVTVLLGIFRKIGVKIPVCNVTSVTMLDVVVSKNLLAAKLKTTTDKIKNVVIWGSTFPDISSATVTMYPPGDRGNWKVKEIPISEAIQDEKWLFTTFRLGICRRPLTPDLLKYGKAVTQSVVQHLRYLFEGSDKFDEIQSMAVIAPANKVYGVPPDLGFSFPVKTVNGTWKIIEDIKYDTATHLHILRSIYNNTQSPTMNSLMKVTSYMMDYDSVKKYTIPIQNRHFVEEILETRNWVSRYFVTPNPAEGVFKVKDRTRESKKSIAWDDESTTGRKKLTGSRSVIRFSVEKPEKEVSLISRRSRRTSVYSTKSDDLMADVNAINSRSPPKL